MSYLSSEYSEESDGTSLYRCRFCKNIMDETSLKRHQQRKHSKKCNYCNVWKLEDAIDQHERSHYIKCRYCKNLQTPTALKLHEATHLKECNFCKLQILKENETNHVREKHSIYAAIGMIQSLECSDANFNKLSKEGRIYAQNGRIFVEP